MSRFETKCWACSEPGGKFHEYMITRRNVEDDDVHVEIKYTGICHSDIHQAHGDWPNPSFPMVPGHEIVGFVKAIGKNVTKVKVGDRAGVGCMVESCRKCSSCKTGLEQYCQFGRIGTYNARMKYPHCPGYNEDPAKCELTYGGYAKDIVVSQDFILKIPEKLPLEGAAPLLCAGITMYSPLKFYGAEKGMKVAIAGLGGLGAMGVKIAKAMGCHVTVISRGTGKKEEAISVLGADAFIDSKDPAQMAAATDSFDRMISTVAAEHDINPYLNTVAIGGKLICVGLTSKHVINPFGLIMKRKSVVGSLIGGIAETQEMLEFCAEHDISCEVEVIGPSYIDKAFERTLNSDIKWRFCIDCNEI